MDWFTGIATYITIWWTVLFAILPFGVRSQLETGDVASGSEPGAPIRPNLWRKVRTTSLASLIVWLALYLIIRYELIRIGEINVQI